MWAWSKNRRFALVAMIAAGVIAAMAVSGVIVFGSLAGDSFPFTAGFGHSPDVMNRDWQTLYRNLEWFCSMMLIGGVLGGLGSFAAYKIHGKGEHHD